jgi:hypothetical protein
MEGLGASRGGRRISGNGPLQPVSLFRHVTAREPEHPQGPGQPDGEVGIMPIVNKGEGCPQVIVLNLVVPS